MEFVLVVFRSRTESMQAYNYLVNRGFVAALVSTPRAANVGCGLSVKIAKSVLPGVQDALCRGQTFVGFFLVKNTINGTVLSRL